VFSIANYIIFVHLVFHAISFWCRCWELVYFNIRADRNILHKAFLNLSFASLLDFIMLGIVLALYAQVQ